MNKLRDFLTYSAELSGRRHLRTYVKSALFIAAALLGACAVVLGQQYQTMREMASAATIRYATSPTPSEGEAPTPEACPSDPASWQLVGSGLPGEALERIEPACVYAGLGKTIAWALAIREGYSRAEAAQALGFTRAPAQAKMPAIKVIDPLGSAWVASLVQVPLTPGYSEWSIDRKDLPAVVYFPQGCFRGIEARIDTAGEAVQAWNGSYPVICYIIEDNAATHTVMSLGGHVFSTVSSPARSYLYFGYDSDTKQWDWLGIDSNPHTSTDATAMSSDPENYSGQFGGSVWGPQWLSRTYGLAMKALPAGWRADRNPAELQVILNSINSSNGP